MGCPVGCGWAPISQSAEFPPVGPPPAPARSACGSFSPGRRLHPGPAQEKTAAKIPEASQPRSLTGAPPTAFPSRLAPGPPTFPLHSAGGHGESSSSPTRVATASAPVGRSAAEKGPCSGAHSPRERPPRSPQAPRPTVRMCLRRGHLVFKRNELESLGAVLIRYPRQPFSPRAN